ncbi:hypothetical protein HOO65_030660 [Ceratocystis lukuohia]|uniref:Uncharacterized protein n=1 Tax=Ceratocystis lukuohia TaxID=2019550 RepID=A0ABR4MLT6_9PEZI
MAARLPNFNDLFAGASQEVDCSAPEDATLPILPIPNETDDLATATHKFEALAALVKSGKNLAVHTAYACTPYQTRDPAELAKLSMTPAQLKQFEAWRKGIKMPAFDWANFKEPVQDTNASRKRYEQRARAMNAIWKTTLATPENAMYVSMHMVYAVPLLVAVAKVESAQRALVGGSTGLTEMELAELQTLLDRRTTKEN